MTIRITANEGEGGRTVVRAEARGCPPGATLLDDVCSTAVGGPAAVDVDLTGVDFVEERAATVLRDLARRGARLERAGYFVRQVLEVMTTAPGNATTRASALRFCDRRPATLAVGAALAVSLAAGRWDASATAKVTDDGAACVDVRVGAVRVSLASDDDGAFASLASDWGRIALEAGRDGAEITVRLARTD